MKNVSKYKDLNFVNFTDWNAWLGETTKFIIHFVDEAQDLTTMHIDEYLEILHCDAHANIYNNRFVTTMKEGMPVEIDGIPYNRLKIEFISSSELSAFIKWSILAQFEHDLTIKIYPILDFDTLFELRGDIKKHVDLSKIKDIKEIDEAYFKMKSEVQANYMRPFYTAYFKKLVGSIQDTTIDYYTDVAATLLQRSVKCTDISAMYLFSKHGEPMLRVEGRIAGNIVDAEIPIFFERKSLSKRFEGIIDAILHNGNVVGFLNLEPVTIKIFR